MSSQSDPKVFSVRIVSLDYYTAHPIRDLDLCYSSFQGGKVEEVPVIRIYGSTPAGQKACLHVHRALPYLYIPCPDDVLQNTEEGHAFIHILYSALEKALRSKSSFAPKRQHVHGCTLVQAKKLYGYHLSEELFVKIYLYYPHEVARVATLLLSGAVLNKTFQPYESHIPYLLQFLVDYNLYGMSYIHTSKVKFRPPLPDGDMKADPSNDAHGNSAIWLSSTVPSALIWPDSATRHDGLADKTIHLMRRQSICGLEVDSSVDDILNEKYKMYTSLSQTRSEVKMVQSLIPIWEEYERSGMREAGKSPDLSKPLPENVLNSFLLGLDYEKALAELCIEAQKTFASNVSGIKGDEKLEKYIESSTNTGKAHGLLEHQRSSSPCGEPLKCPREESKTVPLPCVSLSQENKDAVPYGKMHEYRGMISTCKKTSSDFYETEDPKILDTEALALLSWLASSQAVDDMSPDYELVHEAILSPLLSTKSYKEALEIAHLDYENASQQECQDILDSVEGAVKSEGLKEQVSCSASHDSMASGSTGNVIPQVDGSVDDNSITPQKGFHSKANMSNGREKSSVHPVGRCTSTMSGSEQRRNKLLWGPLPFPIKQKEHEDSEPAFFISSQDDEKKIDRESSSLSGSKGDRRYDALKVDAGIETSCEKGGKMLDACSVRDLMRRKRCFRTEQSETEVQKNEIAALCPKGATHLNSLREGCSVTSSETPHVESYVTGRDGFQENITCTTTCRQGEFTKGGFQPTDHYSPLNQHSSLSLFSDQVTQPNTILNGHLGFCEGSTYRASVGSRSFAVTGLSLRQAESINLPEPCKSRHCDTAICKSFSEGYEDEMTDASESFMKCATCEISSFNKKLCFGAQRLTSHVRENQSVDEGFRSHLCENHFVSECMQEKQTSATRDLTTIGVEHTILHDASNCMSNQDSDIAQEGLPEMYFNGWAQSDPALGKNIEQSVNDRNGVWDMGISSLNPEYITCTYLHKEKDILEHIEMSFRKKPPSKDQVGRISEDSPWSTGRADGSTDIYDESLAFNCCFSDSDRQGINDLLPFFVRDFEDGKSYKSSLNDENVVSRHESSLGIPIHFQNDGSVLYLLTHAFLPPTLECVRQWLVEVVQRNCLNDGTGDACDGTSPESNAAHHLKPGFLSPSGQENNKSPETENYSSRVNIVSCERQVAGIHITENALMNSSHDISQISGPAPDEESNLTPLSQIGFRDPARIGGGQQLTLMSMEVQAESRGDLRPDPKCDAINVLSLAIQEDTSHTFEAYVLMRGNNEELCQRNIDGVSDCKFVIFTEEKHLLDHFVKIISLFDPDVLMGWEIQGGSLGFLAERAAHLGISLLKNISRTPAYEMKHKVNDSPNPELCNILPEASIANTVLEDAIIEDEWGHTHASGIHVGGRIVLNIWRLMRAELKLNIYSVEAVAEEVLRRKVPSISCGVLNHWFSSGPGRARYRCIEYVVERAKLNLQILNQLDMINRTSELARVFGIDFFSVLSRGSQFRVESMLIRLAHTQNYLAISPGNQQVAAQPAMECLPLVMEPESGFYADPVIVLDFQSLYPSMIIAYNLCFCTCLGTVIPSKAHVLGVSSYFPDPVLLKDLKQQLFITPNGVMYVPPKVRKGVLPCLLEEILSTRIMVKQAMKKLMPSQQVLQRIFNARQLALKLIANVTYGYTAAGFSGRMPCAELADSIVQCGRRTLETAISFVNQHDRWKARVIYGDTDSMFVLLKGRSREEAFRIGNEIASAITAMNPHPVTLKMEKVYQPCFLLTKKRYVGYSYESPDQDKPIFDAKGIETVRRDTCPAVGKTLEQSIRLFFEHQDISLVKSYLLRQWKRILSGKVSFQDFVFAKEVRLGTYSARASSLPPAAIVATKAMRIDPRAEPRYGERISYVVIHGEPGARLVDMVVDPFDLLDLNSPYRLNDLYYINKQIIPALQRVFGLLGAHLNQWFSELPRPVRPMLAKRHSCVSHFGGLHEYNVNRVGISKKAQAKRSRIDTYYISKHCILCGELVQASANLCDQCSNKESLVATAVVGKASRLEREIQHLAAICRQCGGGDWVLESGVKCTSLACSVFYERRKVQKELQAISSFATEAGFYPSCTVEWF